MSRKTHPSRCSKQHVAKVGVGWKCFQVMVNVIVNPRGLRHLVFPLLIAAAVREERHPSPLQTCHLLWRQSTTAGSSQPKILWLIGRHDKRRLLALDDTYVGIGSPGKKVLSEKALVKLPVEWQFPSLDQRYMRPSLIAFSVAVYAVLHDVSAMYLPCVVYLPVDDATLVGCTYQVVFVHTVCLLPRKAEPVGDMGSEPLPEDAARRVTALYILDGNRLEGRQAYRLAVSACTWLARPLVVAIILPRLIVVATGVLVVALAYVVGHIAIVVVRVDVTHETFLLAAVRAGELSLAASRQAAGF